MRNKILVFFYFFTLLTFTSCVESYDGEKIYQTQCANCHGKNGEGLKKLIPPIANSDFIRNNSNLLPCIISNGLHDTIIVNGIMYHQIMEGNKKLSAVDITNLINYINQQWYKEKPRVKHDEIGEIIEKCD